MSSVPPFNFPVVISSTGLQPQDPVLIKQQLLAGAALNSPGYTAELPGIMVEDVASTDVAAISLIDQAKVETVNSFTPLAANEFTIGQLGVIYIGEAQPGKPTNTSVPVVFYGTIGYVVPNGLLVSDGSNDYQVQGGGPILGSGQSATQIAIAVQPGATFGVAANTVNQVRTSVPSSVNLTVNNPQAGTPGGTVETWAAFRVRVLQAGLAACVGSPRFIKTLIGAVPGVPGFLISVQAVSGGLRVIVGGTGDPYLIAFAIFQCIENPASLQGSAVSSGRNITVSLIDPPNTFNIVYVNSPQQAVTIAVTWNTTLSSFAGGGAFQGLAQEPLVAYINAIPAGQPINILEMGKIFQDAVSSVLDPDFLTRLVFSVSINGTATAPGTGTQIVVGDPEGYFFTALNGSGITVTQG